MIQEGIMNPSNDCIELVKASEGCRLTPYRDATGTPTNGWGNTHGVVMGLPITQAKADDDLRKNLGATAKAVNGMVHVQLTQGQFDALCDFAYNLGANALQGSTLLRYINSGNFVAAAGEFGRWVHSKGVVLPGLVTRRAAERALFEGVS